MKIGIANDHHGVEIKQELTNYLKSLGYDVVDYGTNGTDMVDYPLYAFKIGEAVAQNDIEYGILICNSGIGMSIACNKVKGARCAKVDNIWEAEMCRKDNNANVIALHSQLTIDEMHEVINTFLSTKYANIDRYNRRISQIDSYGE